MRAKAKRGGGVQGVDENKEKDSFLPPTPSALHPFRICRSDEVEAQSRETRDRGTFYESIKG